MAVTRLGDKKVGDLVRLNLNGEQWTFRVIQQNSPSSLYDNCESSTWLLMNYAWKNTLTWDINNTDSYEKSTINSFLNGDFIKLFDPEIQKEIKTISIPYQSTASEGPNNNIRNGLKTKAFLLTPTEYGKDVTGNAYMATVGITLEYFKDFSASKIKVADRQTTDNVEQWTRIPYTNSTKQAVYFNDSGVNVIGSKVTESKPIRPCIVLPSYLPINGNMVGTDIEPVDDGNDIEEVFAPLKDRKIGDIIKLKVGEIYKDFIVSQHGKPSDIYDDSCDGTWLVMKDAYQPHQWNVTVSDNYAESDINKYLNNEFFNLFSSDIQNNVKTAKIPYKATGTDGSTTSQMMTGSNGLLTKVFLPSFVEIGGEGNVYIPTVGSKLEYFPIKVLDPETKTYPSAIVKYDNIPVNYWSRDPWCQTGYKGGLVIYTSPTGAGYAQVSDAIDTMIRPCIILPSELIISNLGNIQVNDKDKEFTPLSDREVSQIVKLNIDGKLTNFIVAQQGIPSDVYDESCNGTWLLTEEAIEKRQWNSTQSDRYAESDINKYLNNEFLQMLDEQVQEYIKEVKIPYKITGSDGSATEGMENGSDGLSVKAFLLSSTEYGKSSTIYIPAIGTKLDYFDGTNAMASTSLNGEKVDNWTRTPFIQSSTNGGTVVYIRTGGTSAGLVSTEEDAIRPCIILPADLLVNNLGEVKLAGNEGEIGGNEGNGDNNENNGNETKKNVGYIIRWF